MADTFFARCNYYFSFTINVIKKPNKSVFYLMLTSILSLSIQKGINVQFDQINDANHFCSKTEEFLKKSINKYISKESALFK